MSKVVEVFTTMDFEVKFTRVIDNVLVPSHLKFTVDFEPLETTTEDEIQRSFAKIRYWLDNIVSRSLIFSYDNSDALAMFVDDHGHTRVGNVVMITPEEPDDQHLCALFQAKLAALSSHTVEFGPIEVRSDNHIGLSFTFVGDSNDVLPTTGSWLGPRSYFVDPWWNRDDGSTMDVIPPEDADLTVKPAWAFTFEFLDRPRHASQPEVSSSNEENTVVLRPNFRPTVIEGGKEGE